MKNILYTIILCLLSINLLAEERYSCTVEEFSTSSSEEEFIEQNLKRQFLITVTEDQIFTTMILFNNRQYQNIYTIIGRGLSKTVAVNDEPMQSGRSAILIIDTNINDKKREIKAIVTLYDRISIRLVWFLKCL